MNRQKESSKKSPEKLMVNHSFSFHHHTTSLGNPWPDGLCDKLKGEGWYADKDAVVSWNLFSDLFFTKLKIKAQPNIEIHDPKTVKLHNGLPEKAMPKLVWSYAKGNETLSSNVIRSKPSWTRLDFGGSLHDLT